MQVVLGGIDDGHGQRSPIEAPITGQAAIEAQKLLNALLPLVHQLLGMNDDQGGLAASSNDGQGHDGFSRTGAGLQHAKRMGKHGAYRLLLIGA